LIPSARCAICGPVLPALRHRCIGPLHIFPKEISMHATISPNHNGRKIDTHHDGVYLGLWRGRCLPVHGMSKQHLSYLVDSAGGEIVTEERHDELAIDQRVRFRMASDGLGITQVAVGIEPAEPVASKRSNRK
jgi:hypothetical protein